MKDQDLALFARQIVLTSKLPLRYLGDPALRVKCVKIASSEIFSATIRKFSEKLKKTLVDYRRITGVGRGLAANQIGGNLRMCVVWPFEEEKPEVWVNPQIIWRSKEKALYHEICISSLCLGIDVLRSFQVVVCYLDLTGQRHEKKLNPQDSRLIQHEIDHLDGIVCLDKGLVESADLIFEVKAKILGNKFKIRKVD